MKDYKVRYRFQTVKQNTTLLHDDFSCIMFNNQGDTDAIVNNNVIIRPGEAVSFNEDPEVRIDTDFSVKFLSTEDTTDPNVCISCSYYEPLN